MIFVYFCILFDHIIPYQVMGQCFLIVEVFFDGHQSLKFNLFWISLDFVPVVSSYHIRVSYSQGGPLIHKDNPWPTQFGTWDPAFAGSDPPVLSVKCTSFRTFDMNSFPKKSRRMLLKLH